MKQRDKDILNTFCLLTAADVSKNPRILEGVLKSVGGSDGLAKALEHIAEVTRFCEVVPGLEDTKRREIIGCLNHLSVQAEYLGQQAKKLEKQLTDKGLHYDGKSIVDERPRWPVPGSPQTKVVADIEKLLVEIAGDDLKNRKRGPGLKAWREAIAVKLEKIYPNLPQDYLDTRSHRKIGNTIRNYLKKRLES